MSVDGSKLKKKIKLPYSVISYMISLPILQAFGIYLVILTHEAYEAGFTQEEVVFISRGMFHQNQYLIVHF